MNKTIKRNFPCFFTFVMLVSGMVWVPVAGSSEKLTVLNFSTPENAVPAGVLSTDLPLVLIDTNGQSIIDRDRIEADMGIIDNGPGQRNLVTDPRNGYDGKIGIELRGSTAQNWPKRPYRIETHDSLGNDIDVVILGMPEENDWVLHNPYSDKTFIRNVLAYKIANEMGRYASRTRLCEVVLNGEYQGVYVFEEKLKRDRNRVAIARLDSSDVEGESLTGGYIIKVDKDAGEQRGSWRSKLRTRYHYHYPKPDDILPEQEQYIQNFMDEFEAVMASPDYDDPEEGYDKYIDLDSFIDFFIVNEVSKNIDGYRLSTFMFKDRDSRGGKLNMGPVWDFNLAFSNANYYLGERTEGWNLDALLGRPNNSSDFPVPPWWSVLVRDDTFKTRLENRWSELRRDVMHIDSLMTFIDDQAVKLDEAQKRNYERWPVLGQQLWPNAFIGEFYEEEIEYLKEWLETRIEWMDKAISTSVTRVDEPGGSEPPARFVLEPNYPNPFNASTLIRYNLPKRIHVELNIYNLLGQKIRTLDSGWRPGGQYSIVWNGMDDLGQPVSSGVYTYRLNTETESRCRKMMLLR